jgi:hypothetical protein
MTIRKTLAGPVRVKNADLGIVEAVFATFNVVDHDGDLTVPEAIADGAKCVISQYGHTSWAGELPVGHGTITKTATEAMIEATFLLDTPHGRACFDTVKALAEHGLGEWSYGLMNVKAERKTIDGRSVRVIKAVDIPEVSPVLVGAGISTRTLTAKGRKQLASDVSDQLRDLGRERFGDDDHWVYVEDYDIDDQFAIFYVSAEDEPTRLVQVGYSRDGDTITLADEETEVERDLVYSPKSGRRFVEQAKAVVTALDQLVTRAEGIAAKRIEDGKSKALGDDSAALLTDADALLVRLKAIATATPHHDNIDDEARREFARFVGITEGVI